MGDQEARELCGQLRQELIRDVARTGGHLSSNLGVVELTVAIHRVFDTSRDRLVFDVGHQSYPHKMLTGRREQMSTIRQLGGIAGFPKPSESVHDAFIAGHASNSVAVAVGMARARDMLGEDYRVLALIGDGALTGGLAYEGLSTAGQSRGQLLVILNDNGMSITKNVGGRGGAPGPPAPEAPVPHLQEVLPEGDERHLVRAEDLPGDPPAEESGEGEPAPQQPV